MTEYERVQAMRREWAPPEKLAIKEESALATHEVRAPQIEATGVRYQQCGGGRRVLRKKVGE